MTRRGRIALLLALLLSGVMLGGAPTGAASTSPRYATQRALPGIQAPALTAPVAFAVDLTTGVELYAQDADTPAAPASTMKIVTALLARQLLPLDTQVTVQDSDLLDPTVFSTMGLQAGDIISVGDLLRGLLLPSGGDAGNAIARVAGKKLGASDADAVSRFMQELNDLAARLGMSKSHFTNPIGADDPDEVATARDLTRAAQQLLADQFLYQIVGTAETTVHVNGPNARDIPLVNSNQLLARDDVFGVKTGTEDTAGQCLITGFWRGDDQILTVVLGSQDRYADTTALMDAIDAAYQWQALGIGAASAGAGAALEAQGLTFAVRRTVLMTRAQASALTYDIDVSDAGSDRDARGVVVFRLGARVVARLPVYSGLPR